MSTIKIITGYAQINHTISSDYHVNIHVGRDTPPDGRSRVTQDDFKWLSENLLGDNTGDNISSANLKYGEITAMYWVWKNYSEIGNPDYIGFQSYRRYFFYPHKWTIIPQMTPEYERMAIQSIEQIKMELAPDTLFFTSYSENSITNQEILQESPMSKAFAIAHDIVLNDFPAYVPELTQFLADKNCIAGNSFIMSREYFFEYCEFMFPLLKKLDEQYPYTNELQNFNTARIPAVVSEYYMNLFYLKKRNQGSKIILTNLLFHSIQNPRFLEKNDPRLTDINLQKAKYLKKLKKYRILSCILPFVFKKQLQKVKNILAENGWDK